MTLGDVISNYRKTHELSMEQFANRAGMSKAYVSMLERNRTQRGDEPAPSIEKYRAVAQVIGMSVDELIRLIDGNVTINESAHAVPPGFEPLPRMVKIPLVGRIACGDPITAEENLEGYVEAPEEIRCDFALRCQGDSMIDAGIEDGDLVYIRCQPEVENGDIAAVRIGDEATLKRIYFDGTQLTIMPCNPRYTPKTFTGEELEDIHIEGKAVGYTHWLE